MMDALEIDKRLGELGKDVHTVLRVTSGLISQMQVYQQREKEELHVKENLEERLGTQAQHLERQNREIEQLRAVIKSMQDERTEALKESDKEISAQNQIIKLKYEVKEARIYSITITVWKK